MINTIPHHFYSIIDPPNKKDLLFLLESTNLSTDNTPDWVNHCNIKFERVEINQDLWDTLYPSLDIFFREVNLNIQNLKLSINDIWKNTYKEGFFQEVHDHLPLHLSGVIFLTDEQEDDGKFFFFNQYASEVSKEWRDIGLSAQKNYVKSERGKILLFPSYMLHGVSMHKTNNPRKTIAFNIEFNTSIPLKHPY
tara:strand:- start:121 stop:702 length:582 start_codon:yes stop_codon:yes gene_type:complete